MTTDDVDHVILRDCAVERIFLLKPPNRANVRGMEHALSSQSEQYLTRIIAGGLFPSKEAALDAAVAALQEKAGEAPFVLAEHMQAVEQGLDEAEAGLSRPMTTDDWSRLRQRAREVSAAHLRGAT